MNVHNDQHRIRPPLAAAGCRLVPNPRPLGEGRSPQATRRGEVRVLLSKPSPSGRGQGEGAVFPSTTYRLPLIAHRGFTLAELLIVVLIISIVTVATIPFLKPALDSRRIREAARLFTSQLAAAQSQAIANGNSVGVWMEKTSSNNPTITLGNTDTSMDLSLCEVPDPYSGDTSTSTVVVNVTPPSVPGNANVGTVTMNNADTAWVGLIHKDDLIRFNNSGPYYVLSGPINNDRTLIQTPPPSATVFGILPVQPGYPSQLGGDDFFPNLNPAFRYLPPAAWTTAGWTTPFQIIRQPARSAGSPVSLPSGAVIDTHFSGMGNTGFVAAFSSNGPEPIELIFDKSGAVESVYFGGTKYAVTAPLYFLIGKREKAFTLNATNPAEQNWTDPDNIWVSVNPHTGVASATEVASGSSGPPSSLSQSRAFAISAQAMGGK
jgi:prepilin-type N-terminal cleavage/methylation domain-containing protein